MTAGRDLLDIGNFYAGRTDGKPTVRGIGGLSAALNRNASGRLLFATY